MSGQNSMLWLFGFAGIGKNALSMTITNQLLFVFFDRDVRQRNDPEHVITTKAYQLGLYGLRRSLPQSRAHPMIPFF